MAATDVPIPFAELRAEAGLVPLAGGEATDSLFVAPLNASSLNAALLTGVGESLPVLLSTGLPKGSTASDVLSAFTWRTHPKVGPLLTPVPDQGTCGCCWAVAVTGCINDRLVVLTGRNPSFAFQELMACVGECPLCGTCTAEAGFRYVSDEGLTAADAVQGTPDLKGVAALGLPSGLSSASSQTGASGGGLEGPAPLGRPLKGASCQAVNETLFRAAQPKKQRVGGVPRRSASILALQHSILHSGPVVTVMRVYVDFVIGSDPRLPAPFEATEGIYVHRHGATNYGVPPNRNKDLGTHCMVIVGWGRSAKGVRYWEIRNSWGPGWGDKGYCKVAMTDAALANASVGVDLSITTIKGNVATNRYGNIWVDVGKPTDAPSSLYGQRLNRSAQETVPRVARAYTAPRRRAVLLLLLGCGLLLLFLRCMSEKSLAPVWWSAEASSRGCL